MNFSCISQHIQNIEFKNYTNSYLSSDTCYIFLYKMRKILKKSQDACFGYPCKTGLCTCGIKPAKPAEKPAKPGEKPADKPAEKPTL